jgi:hypothetical protein
MSRLLRVLGRKTFQSQSDSVHARNARPPPSISRSRVFWNAARRQSPPSCLVATSVWIESRSGAGARLPRTERTVEKHVNGIFARLRLPASPEDHRRVLAVLAYLRA